MKPVLVVGAGGHGRVICETLIRSGKKVAGFVDTNPDLVGKNVMGLPVFAEAKALNSESIKEHEFAFGLGSTSAASLNARNQIARKMQSAEMAWAEVVDPSAQLARDASLSEAAQLMMGTCVQTGVRIGAFTIVNTRASIDHDCSIGNFCHIGPGAVLSGNVTVGNDVHVGTGAVIIQGIKIGDGAVVGAGAVVVRDVPKGATVVGVPAQEKK